MYRLSKTDFRPRKKKKKSISDLITKSNNHKFETLGGWVGVRGIQKIHILETAKFERNKDFHKQKPAWKTWEAPKTSWKVELGDCREGSLILQSTGLSPLPTT